MIGDRETLFYILVAFSALVVLFNLFRACKMRVWIKTDPKKTEKKHGEPHEKKEIGYLDYEDKDDTPECAYVHLSGGGKVNAIGRVLAGTRKIIDEEQQRDENGKTIQRIIVKDGQCGIVHMLASPLDEDDPRYNPCGYIDSDGYIYEEPKGAELPRRIGYVARPSNPNVPTLKGERSIWSLFLRCRLNAYWGLPDKPSDDNDSNVDENDKETILDPTPDKSSEDKKSSETDGEVDENDKEEQKEETEKNEKEENLSSEEDSKDVDMGDEDSDDEDSDDEDSDDENSDDEDSDDEASDDEDSDDEDSDDEDSDDEDSDDEDSNGKIENSVGDEQDEQVSKVDKNDEDITKAFGEFLRDTSSRLLSIVSPSSNPEYLVFGKNMTPDGEEAEKESVDESASDSDNVSMSGVPAVSEPVDVPKQPLNTLNGEPSSVEENNIVTETEKVDEKVQITEDSDSKDDVNDDESEKVVEEVEEKKVEEKKGEEKKGEEKKGEDSKKEENSEKEENKTENKEEKEDKKESREEKKARKKGEKERKEKELKEKESKIAAECSSFGWRIKDKRNDITPEARACAYAMFYNENKTNRNYSEYYERPSYSWVDTALLTTLIYVILFTILYVVNTGILHLPLLGNDLAAVFSLIAFYFVLWALVRRLKIEAIETSNTIQPKLDLLNKSLGMRGMDLTIIFFSFVGIIFTYCFYDYDFIPLIFSIVAGILLNMRVKNVKKPWDIRTSLHGEQEEYVKTEIPENPEGDIARTYEWDLDSSEATIQLHGSLTLYFDHDYMTDVRQFNPFFNQRMDKTYKEYVSEMYHFMAEHPLLKARVEYIAYYIDKLAEKNSLFEKDKIQFVLDFAQEPNIKFTSDIHSKYINYNPNYVRFPDETLFDKEGDSDCKAFLAAMILRSMDYRVIFMTSKKHKHAALGVEYKGEEWMGAKASSENIFDFEGHKYVFCETTNDKFKVGEFISGMTIEDFESKVELKDEAEGPIVSSRGLTKLYNWDLDSWYGNSLHGKYVMNIDEYELDTLRQKNPFREYGKDGSLYKDNIVKMQKILKENPELNKEVKEIVKYIQSVCRDSELQELDRIQFTLDFVQSPNITYMKDEDCATINFAKEYMRFPLEVLFDKAGDCDCKVSLATALFNALGYDVLILLSTKLEHAAIGVECKDESWINKISSTLREAKSDSEATAFADEENGNLENQDFSQEEFRFVKEYDGKKYLYCETTGDGFKVGDINNEQSIQDFEIIVQVKA